MIIEFSPTNPNYKFDTQNDSKTSYTHLISLFDELLNIMKRYLPSLSTKSLTVAYWDTSHPVCFRQANQIFLHAEPQQWAKNIYQLSHELCHLSINTDVCKKIAWLEESLCELSSYFFMEKLAKCISRKQLGFESSDGTPYSECLLSYIADAIEKAFPFEINQLCTLPKPQLLADLQQDEYIRSYNAFVAVNLLPIFKRFPKTWFAIPYMDSLPASSLENTLKEWFEIAPLESRNGLIEILRLFGG